MLSAAGLTVAPLTVLAQQPAPGTEGTPAMTTQVPKMKPDCPPKTSAGDKQKQHMPTDVMNKNVPAMTDDDKCATDPSQTKNEEQPK
jgi:hypothetical protein